MREEAELYARLPLDAASLAADLKHKGAMSFNYASNGQRVAEKPPTSLAGRCEGATHYVRSLTIGAFRLGALSDTAGGAGVQVATAGVGGSGESHRQRDRSGGNLETCLKTGGASGCDAILQLGLVELNLGAQEAGFGSGLGTLMNIPMVPQGADGLGSAPTMSFGDLDMTWRKLVEAATLSDADETQLASQRIKHWRAVAEYAGGDADLKAKAKDRADAWQRNEDARLERQTQVEAAHKRFQADSAKLEQLLGISDRVVSAAQKKAYRSEFERVYGPWKKAFEESGRSTVGPPAAGGDSSGWVRLEGGRFEFQGKKTVTLRPFAIGRTEVTVAEYRRCVDAGKCSAPNTDGDCNWGKSDRDRHPVNCVDWAQASAYATWAGARLPSEAEWEFAATSGGQGITYPWGDSPAPSCERVIMGDGGNGCGKGGTWPVCSKSPGNSKQGLCDLAGNVWEWTADWYHADISDNPSDGSPYMQAATDRVGRGGSRAISPRATAATTAPASASSPSVSVWRGLCSFALGA